MSKCPRTNAGNSLMVYTDDDECTVGRCVSTLHNNIEYCVKRRNDASLCSSFQSMLLFCQDVTYSLAPLWGVEMSFVSTYLVALGELCKLELHMLFKHLLVLLSSNSLAP
ncbi:hypothetical protein VNO77_17060 [Canavalia gladiata]|uniref:Uncharacterized protein n=1 Tax=Canavalia gladiata TaxID=3824 RepID=A0AAN9LM23_CANGL